MNGQKIVVFKVFVFLRVLDDFVSIGKKKKL